jgi:hypothetical protein
MEAPPNSKAGIARPFDRLYKVRRLRPPCLLQPVQKILKKVNAVGKDTV